MGLPPGQRPLDHFPRFGVPAFAHRWPTIPERPVLVLSGGELDEEVLALDDLAALPRREIIADFHCVTTWTRQEVRWSGFAFRDFYQRFLRPRAQTDPRIAFVELTALDGYRSTLPLEDVLRDNVLLADRVDDAPLPLEHGAPLRLVAPDHYGYKSVKHLKRIRVGRSFSVPGVERLTRAHPRGRVALEERGRLLGGRFYRFIYRALMYPTLWYYRRARRPD